MAAKFSPSRGFKVQAVGLIINGSMGAAALAKKLKVSVKDLQEWRRLYGGEVKRQKLSAKEEERALKKLKEQSATTDSGTKAASWRAMAMTADESSSSSAAPPPPSGSSSSSGGDESSQSDQSSQSSGGGESSASSQSEQSDLSSLSSGGNSSATDESSQSSQSSQSSSSDSSSSSSSSSGPQSVTIKIESEIRSPDPETGTKTWHYVEIDKTGKILAEQSFIGITDSPWPFPGSGTLNASVTGSYPQFTVHFTGTAISAYVEAAAIAATLLPFAGGIGIGVILANLAIDYDVSVTVDFSDRTGTIFGAHDGYPSYMIHIDSKNVHEKVYDFPQTTDMIGPVNVGILTLLPPMDISPSGSFTW